MAETERRVDGGTEAAILDVAERLVQTRGFNGVSYADIAEELSITKASLHYHFPTKADLGRALIERYSARFAESLIDIEAAAASAPRALRNYAGLYADVLAQDRMCLCGMLAAEYETLPDPMQDAIVRFFAMNEDWLTAILSRGRHERSLAFSGTARDAARGIVGGLEGAMLVARARGADVDFRASAERLVRSLAGVWAAGRRRTAAG
jgi:TetR/AcrR family transcriptional repressor of nem operon